MEGRPMCHDWMQRYFEKEAKKDVLPNGERFGQIVGIIFAAIFIAFFSIHLNSNTGLFRSNFGAFEALLFFGASIYGVIPAILKFIFGRKNRVRPFEIIGDSFFLIAAIYLLATWPFETSHLADLCPSDLAPIISWISDQFVQILATIILPVLAFFIVWMFLTYNGVKKELEKVGAQPIIEPIQPT